MFKRWKVVTYWRDYGNPSLRQVARACHCSPTFVSKWINVWVRTGNVASPPRKSSTSGLRQRMATRVVELVQQAEYRTVDRVAARLLMEFLTAISASTIRRMLKAANLWCVAPRFEPLLTRAHKANRVAFATQNMHTNWQRVMFTDSKYFYMHPNRKGGLKQWVAKGTRPIMHTVKNNQCVHVYMGVTAFGATTPIFATGTTGRPSQFIDPRTQRAHRGVCALEYQHVILPRLIQDGSQLFSQSLLHAGNWVFQQDGASVHRAVHSTQLVAQLVPGGLLQNWPPNSPDLSWIENIWAWMEHQLRRRPVCCNARELEALIMDIWEDLVEHNVHILRNCVASMSRRMREVIGNNGAHVGS